jgi:hypothetical protein
METIFSQRPQVKATCHRLGIDCSYEHSVHVANTISPKQLKHRYVIASSDTWFGIMQSGHFI